MENIERRRVAQGYPTFVNNPRTDQLRRVQDEGLALFVKKNAKYGDAFAEFGHPGVIIRLNDKMQRAKSLLRQGGSGGGGRDDDDESLRDTLLDMHNYAGMAVMLLDEFVAAAASPCVPPSVIHKVDV